MKLFFFIKIRLTNRPPKKQKKPKKEKTKALPEQDTAVDKPSPQADETATPDKKTPAEKDKKKSSGGYLNSLKPKSFSEAIYLVKAVFESIGKPTRLFCKGCAIRDIDIDFIVANEDAAKCAILYGTVNMLLYNTLAWLSRAFRVRKRRISVGCLYNSPASKYDLSLTVSICPLIAIGAAIGLLARFWLRTRNGLSEAAAA